jgi:hypothetical protein
MFCKNELVYIGTRFVRATNPGCKSLFTVPVAEVTSFLSKSSLNKSLLGILEKYSTLHFKEVFP